MLDTLANLDRRWIFLLMAIAVGVPILLQTQFPEKPTGLAENVFDEIENLPDGSTLLMAWDFDPASEGELGPMATQAVRHCCEKKHKMIFITLWPVGQQMIEESIEKVIKPDYPQMKYGLDYVNLGFKSGYEGVIKVIVTNLREMCPTDVQGTSLGLMPLTRNLTDIRQTDLVVNVSAGYPGTKEWVQYAASAYPNDITIVGGCTGVQAPLLYPYIPDQLPGLLGAIKGAAEYEELVSRAYPEGAGRGVYVEARRRMGPQLVAHLLMIGLIVAGNVVFFMRGKA